MIEIEAIPSDAGQRLDHVLQRHLPQYSRARLQEWIKADRVRVDGLPAKPSALLRAGARLTVEPAAPAPLNAFPEAIPLRILYEDAAALAVDKPAGMTVHAGAGAHAGTLVNALLHRFGELSRAAGDDRPGIVHRLDKNTSGVILVARTDAAHRALAAQFSSRTVEKVYLALVQGSVKLDHGFIDQPIERDPKNRVRMTARTGHGRRALTEYRVVERFAAHTLLDVRIHTGRTHQIRAHMAWLGHPVAGDRVYGAQPDPSLPQRFFLHARRIAFVSPATGERVTLECGLPRELEDRLADLRASAD
ncbi:MAG: RluA family pseudouridine synthase [Bryobacteraceae bacterium]